MYPKNMVCVSRSKFNVCVAECPDVSGYDAGELWPTSRRKIISAKAQRSFKTAVTVY
jgi:hypothetical protein